MNTDEKSLLRQFLGIYIISTFVMTSIIMWLLYNGELQSLKENERLKMQQFTSKIAAELIDAQMMQREPDLKEFTQFHYTLYDKDKKPLMGRNNVMVQWQETYYMSSGASLYVSHAAKGHHGVEYIVADDLHFEQDKKKAQVRLIAIYILVLIGIVFIAWILSRIFLHPIRQKVESMDKFVKDSTHELNTPITSLMLSVDALEKDPSSHKNLKRIKLSAKKLSNLYSDLSFLQLTDKAHMENENINLKTVVLEVIDFFEPYAQQKKISIETHLESHLFIINKEAAFRLFSNLLSNAIKYTPVGGTVDLKLQSALFSICDTGAGIDKQKQEAIFNRYQRFDNVNGGFGIGLDIVASIAVQYNITVKVDSQKGSGSCFTLKFY